MANGKKSFVAYCDWKDTFEALPDEKAGQLVKHLFKYVNDENPNTEDILINAVFANIKQTLKRDLKKYEKKADDYSRAGKESAKNRKLAKDQLYILMFYGNGEKFIKVGVTQNSISRRFSSKGDGIGNAGYNYDILYQYFDEELSISITKLEEKIKIKFNKDTYMPSNKFAGYTECYNYSILNELKKYAATFNNVEQSLTNSTVSDSVSDSVSVINISFVQFWDLYDKKTGDKKKLETKWNKLKDSEREEIILYIPKYKLSQPDKQYRKNPSTFLNQRGWEDELIYKEVKKQNNILVQ